MCFLQNKISLPKCFWYICRLRSLVSKFFWLSTTPQSRAWSCNVHICIHWTSCIQEQAKTSSHFSSTTERTTFRQQKRSLLDPYRKSTLSLTTLESWPWTLKLWEEGHPETKYTTELPHILTGFCDQCHRVVETPPCLTCYKVRHVNFIYKGDSFRVISIVISQPTIWKN